MLSAKFPDELVATHYGERVRLVDDGFNKICAAVADGSVSVRTMVRIVF